MTSPALQFLLLTVCGWVNRRHLATIEYLREENRVLREQLGGRRLRFTTAQRRRLAAKGRALGRRALRELGTVVTPDTIMRWNRQLIAKKYDGSAKRGPGRPRKSEEIRQLVLTMAKDNRGWGYTRIAGELGQLGLKVSRCTVCRILAEHDINPAPKRGKTMDWKTFLRAHWGAIAAMDFFTVEVLSMWGPTRYSVLFVIDLKTRRVDIAGIVHQPHGAWMMQIGRNLLDAVDGFLLSKTHLIMDRDPVFTAQFRRLLRDSGVEPLRLPAKSPNLNAYAERFVGSVRRECLDHLVLLSESHLRAVVTDFVEHYHGERCHQGVGNVPIESPSLPANVNGDIRRRQRLGGLLSHYHRVAA